MSGHKPHAGVEPPQPAVPVTGLPGVPIEQEVHVLDRLHVLYKYRKAMVSVTLLVLIGGIVQTATTTPAYESTAQVRAEPQGTTTSALAEAQQMMASSDPESFMQTELNVLQSRDLKLKVVRALRLDKDAEFMTPQGPQGLRGQFDAIRGRIMGPINAWLEPPERLVPAGVPTGEPPPKPLSPEQIVTPEESAAIDAMSSSVRVELVQVSHLFVIYVSSTNPATASNVANELAKQYEKQNLERKSAAVTGKLAQINEQVARLDAEIKANQLNLINKTTEANVLDPAEVSGNVAKSQNDMSNKTAAMMEAKAKMEELTKLDPDKDYETALKHPDIAKIPQVGMLRGELTRNKNEKSRAATTFGANAPQMKDIDQKIEQTETALKLVIRDAIDAARTVYGQTSQAATSAKLMWEAQQRLQVENNKTGIPYQQLRLKVLSDQTLLADMSKQQKQLEIMSQGVENNVSIVEYAHPSTYPYKPDTPRNILMALAVGLGLAIMLAFGLDYIDDTIKTPEDVTRKLHIPFLGLVPAVRGDKQPVLSGPVPHDFGEAYRALRTSLVFTSGGETTRMITVTSAQPLEGKTTTACNLAMVLAFGGSRVLLIDADMRRPGVHKTLKMNNTVGLSHLLVGQARVREAIQRTSDPNFCVMTAGRTPPNPSELLASERMKQLIANLKQGPFDWVVIDTPPVLAVTDAVILTPLVDGVTFVLGAEMTRRRLAERAVQMLMVSRPRVIGGVLNRVNFDRNKYYYSRYYGYQYKSYYGTDAPAAGAEHKG